MNQNLRHRTGSTAGRPRTTALLSTTALLASAAPLAAAIVALTPAPLASATPAFPPASARHASATLNARSHSQSIVPSSALGAVKWPVDAGD